MFNCELSLWAMNWKLNDRRMREKISTIFFHSQTSSNKRASERTEEWKQTFHQPTAKKRQTHGNNTNKNYSIDLFIFFFHIFSDVYSNCDIRWIEIHQKEENKKGVHILVHISCKSPKLHTSNIYPTWNERKRELSQKRRDLTFDG